MAADSETLRVLHLDDDPFELERVRNALEKNAVECRFTVENVTTVTEYRERIKKKPVPDIVILDIHIDEDSHGGIELAGETRRLSPSAVIMMCSTADDVGTIAECLNAGADDFISKQSDKGELSLRVYNSYRLARLKQGAPAQVRNAAASRHQAAGSTMEKVSRRVPLIIDSAISAVFIRGESGTGKEVVADLFGEALGNNTPFIKVNCGAIAPTLLESELFGHVKGAFTGAATDKKGLLEAASGGWIFLDEVATLSPQAQVALLRVLENQELLRVGSTKPVKISIRVLSATNEPMESLVKQGRFRADLWQRLREAEIALPPLRERPAEIPQLVKHFCAAMPGGPYQVSGPVMEILSNVSWKEGNIRELRNCLRAMTEMHVNKLLTPLSVPERIWEELGDHSRDDAGQGSGADDGSGDEQAASPRQSPTVSRTSSTVTAGQGSLTLPWDPHHPVTYDIMADRLLLEITRSLAAESGKLSLRGLSQTIGMSRSTLSGRFKAMIQNEVTDITALAQIVGISEK